MKHRIIHLFCGWLCGILMMFSVVGIVITIGRGVLDIPLWQIIAVVVVVAVIDGIALAMINRRVE